ncbi:MAG TPA: hypothetical protein VGF26_05240 [Ramlibacter sp.]
MADKKRLPWLLALLAAAALQSVHAQDGAQPMDTLPVAGPGAPWWSGSHDATLNLLLAAADRSVAAPDRMKRETAVAAEYFSARYNTLRLVTARELSAVARRRLDLIERAGGAEDEALRQARQLAQEAADRVAPFEALRADALARLAGLLDGYSPRTLSLVLQPALQDTRIVLPAIDVPQQVPGGVLRRRADVAAAEADLVLAGRVSSDDQMRFARYVQALSTAIEPQPPAPAQEATTGTDIGDVLERARVDVGRKVWQLLACMQAAREARKALDKADVQLREARDKDIGELEALDLQAQVLVAADRMAVAAGAVSLAWVAWQGSIGGAGSAQLSAVLTR